MITVERHEPWVGLAYVELHGLPGFPMERPVVVMTNAERKRRQRDRVGIPPRTKELAAFLPGEQA